MILFKFIIVMCYFVNIMKFQTINEKKSDEVSNDCEIENLQNWNEVWVNIMDTQPDGVVKIYQSSNIKKLSKVIYPTTNPFQKYFSLNFDEKTGVIGFELLKGYKDYEKNEDLTQFVITGEFSCKSDEHKNLSLTVNITDTNNYNPQFAPNPPFAYTVMLPAGEGTPILPLYGEFGVKDNDLTTYGIDFNIMGNDSLYFNITTGRKSNQKKVTYFPTIVLKKPLMSLKESLVLNISVTDLDLTGEDRRRVFVNVTLIPDNIEIIFPVAPLFEQPFYTGTLKNKKIQLDNVITFPKHYNDFVQINLKGEMSKYFTYTIEENLIDIQVSAETSSSEISDIDYFIFTLEAANEYDLTGFTVINIRNTGGLLGGSGTTNPAYFSTYFFDNNTLSINKIKMKCNSTFALEDYTEYFMIECISENEVKINVIKNLPKRIGYANDYIAINILDDFSILTVIVMNFILTEVQIKPLEIIQIEEEKEYNSLLKVNDEECQYGGIVDVWPKEAINWFDFNENEGTLSTAAIDREHPAIAFMNVSQIQIEFSIECNYKRNHVPRGREGPLDTSNTEERHWIYTKDINDSQNKVLVNIIVNDINDNPPVFQNSNPLYLYYPLNDLASKIRPPYLVALQATDADIGENAKIKYSTNSDKFAVHSDTGVVYPVQKVFDSLSDGDIIFNISATDGDGKGKHTENIEILVKPLADDNVVILTVNGAMIEDSSQILEDLSNRTSCRIIQISLAVLPNVEYSYNPNNHLGTERDTSLAMFIYAVNNKNEILNGNDLEKLINEDNDLESTSVVPLSSVRTENINENMEGFYIATIILATALSILVVGFIVVFVMKKYFIILTYDGLEETNSSQTSIQNCVEVDCTGSTRSIS